MRKKIFLGVVLLSHTLIAQSQPGAGSEAAFFGGVAKTLFGFTGQDPSLLTQGVNTVQQFQQPSPSFSRSSQTVTAPAPVQALSSAQANQAAIQACLGSGSTLAECQLMNTPLTGTKRTTDDVLFETAIQKSKTAGPSEIVTFLDLNYVAFLMVSFSHVLANYINPLGKFDVIDPLTVTQLKPAPIKSLINKTSLPSSTTPTPLSWGAITQNISARLPKIKFTWANYVNAVTDKSIDRGGVVLIFTNTSTNAKRVILVPHPQMKGFSKFKQKIPMLVSKDIGFDMAAPAA